MYSVLHMVASCFTDWFFIDLFWFIKKPSVHVALVWIDWIQTQLISDPSALV